MRTLLVPVLIACGWSQSLCAQQLPQRLAPGVPPQSAPAQSAPVQTPPEVQRQTPDTRSQSRIDQLFERLAASRNEAETGNISEQITRIWNRSGSDTLDLLMERVGTAMKAQDQLTALDLLDSILLLKADWPEAYSRRAAVLFQQKDMDGAMRDLRKSLALEPRHFQALAGVGMIFRQNEQPKQALAAFRAALAINPHFKGIKEAADKLAQEHGDHGI
jgi:tetratricopeptide (TPR) repeat protein